MANISHFSKSDVTGEYVLMRVGDTFPTACPLCGGPLVVQFTKTVTQAYDITDDGKLGEEYDYFDDDFDDDTYAIFCNKDDDGCSFEYFTD